MTDLEKLEKPADRATEIARGLSEAQRRWILAAEPNPRLGGELATYPPSSTCRVLHRMGLWLWCGMLTEAGLALRQHLLEQQHG
jgi:hypothetical protein